jgi:C1A family cysteine protease
MSEVIERPGMGWIRDLPSIFDYTVGYDKVSLKLQALGQERSIKDMLSKIGVETPAKKLPRTVDLRQWCSPIEDQGNIGSCTAHAGVGMVEFFEKKAFNNYIDASRLFLYKVTRNLLQLTGDTGAFLRSTMGALVLFGVPPEQYYPYVTSDFDNEPPAFCYAFGQNFQAITYYRLDPPGTTPEALLTRIKTNLAASLPAIFGFTVYSSYTQANTSGKIPFPAKGDTIAGGHAIMAVGYDDDMKIENTNPGGGQTKGALMFRNSWGTGWGDQGYGWLPYDYVLKSLAVDWWALLKNEWVDTGAFGLSGN